MPIDMKPSIITKSDQLNADDLIGGAMTITVTDVKVNPTSDQPVIISYEGDKGKPYKPCKSMCRILIMMWGDDGEKYIGQSIALFRDDSVKWGGAAVGGIRISHMTGISEKRVVSLTVTRGSKKPYSVEPLILSQDNGVAISDADFASWQAKIEAASNAEEIAAVGKEIGDIVGSYNKASAHRLRTAYADRNKAIREQEASSGLPDDEPDYMVEGE